MGKINAPIKHFNNTIIGIILSSIFLIILFTVTIYAQKQIDKANMFQLHSFKLANRLFQSSNDLTRMVRTFAITKNPLYAEHYQEILDIRNGLTPIPIDYDKNYWNLVLADDKRPSPYSKYTLSLLQRMEQAKFTDKEFSKLLVAKANSDALTKLEFKAIQAIKVPSLSHNSQEKIIQSLYDTNYHKEKKLIMQPITELYNLVQTRTHKKVNTQKQILYFVNIALSIDILFLLFLLFRLRHSLGMILGSSMKNIHEYLTKIGQGDFSSNIFLQENMKESITGLICKTQDKLQSLNQHNQQLSNFYTLLSQCSQATVHAKNEQELFDKIIKSTIAHSSLELAWIGKIDATAQNIKIVSFDGKASDYVQDLSISIETSSSSSQGPAGRAYFTNSVQYMDDFQHNTKSTPWHKNAKKFNLQSVASFPLRQDGKVVGVFLVYANTQDAFTNDTKLLLEEINKEINFALENFQHKNDIAYLANYDILTGLANRRLLNDHFNYTLHFSKRHKHKFALMFLDLDHFKEINDTLGHKVGDLLLVEVAKRLKSLSREEDTIARQGGDEFILLFPNTDVYSAALIVQKITTLIATPYIIEEKELMATVSVGIAMYPSDGQDMGTLLKKSDSAMYQAKEDGRNMYHFYTQTMQQDSTRRLELSNALYHAIENKELEVFYQPQIDTKSEKLIGAESLLRWTHPKFGSVSPAEFIPIAEENGLILPIGEWVLRSVIQQMKVWLDSGNEAILVAVNLSALQFRLANIAELVEGILQEVGLAPEYLELELTEGMAMKNPQNVINTMNALHDKGIRMSIDDFGTGYSSLSYLKKFKVYKLKIDQSFVRDISVDADDKAIVHSIISLAKGLGLKTIAEGVETKEQLQYLQEQGCDEIQGYYFSKPLCKKDFEHFRENLNKNSV